MSLFATDPAPLAVVTGATGGIGRWIALGLAGAGCRLALIGRDPGRLAAVRSWIGGRVPGADIATLRADLSLLGQTRDAAEAVLALSPRVALLVNNAGTFQTQRLLTVEGRETVLATNHLSPVLLTRALLPALQAQAAATGVARIVTVGSSSSDHARIRPDDLELAQGWGMVRAYSQSKLAVMIAGFEQSRRLAGSGVTLNVVHPGLVATGLVKAGGAVQLGWKAVSLFGLTEAQGAETPLHAALSPELRGVTGRYLKRRQIVRPNPLANDRDLAERVWTATAALIDETMA